jgi:hypothetical protein
VEQLIWWNSRFSGTADLVEQPIGKPGWIGAVLLYGDQGWDVIGRLIVCGNTRPARKRQGYEHNPAEAG